MIRKIDVQTTSNAPAVAGGAVPVRDVLQVLERLLNPKRGRLGA
jgi:hypothetical protein